MGAKIQTGKDWIITGFAGKPGQPDRVIDVINSGTTLRLVAGIAALAEHETRIDGDEQIRKRPMQPLLDALNKLGAECTSQKGNGSCPLSVKGVMRGGTTQIEGITSQYVTSLLLTTPLASGDTVIQVTKLNERPYVEMTLQWLSQHGIKLTYDSDLTEFKIKGNQQYQAFEKRVPADFSSATFPLCAAAITRSGVGLVGLDMNDSQGDKEIVNVIRSMGAIIDETATGIIVSGQELNGQEIDLNNTPDALPSMAVVGCCAKGKTALVNVPQARIKETDRIAVMAGELSKMGAQIEELEDGLVVHQSKLKGCEVDGRGDHRVVMALSLAGLVAEGTTVVKGAEAIQVTFPSYVDLMKQLGADMTLQSER
jgi:3-phosphoshikimate 1-carboxyvinyltransferase